MKRIWYLLPMRAAKVQASLRIRAVSPEPPLFAHTSSESRGTFRQKARSMAPLNGWACAVKICHDWMREDTNSLDAARLVSLICSCITIDVYSIKWMWNGKATNLHEHDRFHKIAVCLFKHLVYTLCSTCWDDWQSCTRGHLKVVQLNLNVHHRWV